MTGGQSRESLYSSQLYHQYHQYGRECVCNVQFHIYLPTQYIQFSAYVANYHLTLLILANELGHLASASHRMHSWLRSKARPLPVLFVLGTVG